VSKQLSYFSICILIGFLQMKISRPSSYFFILPRNTHWAGGHFLFFTCLFSLRSVLNYDPMARSRTIKKKAAEKKIFFPYFLFHKKGERNILRPAAMHQTLFKLSRAFRYVFLLLWSCGGRIMSC